jgi:hypothetical protein
MITSGFIKTIYFPEACLSARLLAFAKPRLSSLHINDTWSNFPSKKALLPSVELLSTTNISAFKLPVALIIEERQCSRKNFTL